MVVCNSKHEKRKLCLTKPTRKSINMKCQYGAAVGKNTLDYSMHVEKLTWKLHSFIPPQKR